MKKAFFALMLLIGLSVMVSCEKEEGDQPANNDIVMNDLFGKWWIPVREEVCFNGSVLDEKPILDVPGIDIYFENDEITYRADEIQFSWPSHLSGNYFKWYPGQQRFEILKVKGKELIITPDISGGGYPISSSTIKDGIVACTFKGVDIYTGGGYDVYWYLDKKNNPVRCKCNHLTKYWDDSLGREVISKFDFWYDADKLYYRAE